MAVREATLEKVVELSRQLSLPERLRLFSTLSEELSYQIVVERSLLPTPDKDKADKLHPADKLDSEEAQLLADLRAAGMLVDPTPEMLARAEEYDAKYSPEEQQDILQELRSLHLDPPLSEIVSRAREFRPGWEWIVEKDK